MAHPTRNARPQTIAVHGCNHVELYLSLSSENAVKTQTWCAIATHVLTAVIAKELQLDASLYTCQQILSVSIFEKTQISCALQQTISIPTCTATPTS
jgi:hypothetical protein